MKVAREGVLYPVGLPGDVVEAGNVAVIPLVEAEEAEEVGGDRVGRRVSFLLPECGVEIVAPTEDSAFPHVEGLCGAL